MKYILLAGLLSTACCAYAQKTNPPTTKTVALYNRTIVQVKPAYRDYVGWVVMTLRKQKIDTDSLKHTIQVSGNAMFDHLSEADINTLLFLVTQAAALKAAEDMRDMMAAQEKQRQKKEALREEEAQIRDAAKPAAYADTKNATAEMDKSRQPKETTRKTVDSSKIKLPAYTAQQAKRLAEILKEKDAISDRGEEDNLQLQLLLDKKKQLEDMISNMMKAMGDTQNTISSNLKG